MDEEESAINRDTPKGLLIWTPTGVHADPSGLPPAEMLEEALNNLNLALHPHTQRQAINSPMDEKVEPSIALYCPIEGGLYVLDAVCVLFKPCVPIPFNLFCLLDGSRACA